MYGVTFVLDDDNFSTVVDLGSPERPTRFTHIIPPTPSDGTRIVRRRDKRADRSHAAGDPCSASRRSALRVLPTCLRGDPSTHL